MCGLGEVNRLRVFPDDEMKRPGVREGEVLLRWLIFVTLKCTKLEEVHQRAPRAMKWEPFRCLVLLDQNNTLIH